MSELIAKAVLIPYLWWGGYQMDEESLAKCYDSIETQCRVDEKRRRIDQLIQVEN